MRAIIVALAIGVVLSACDSSQTPPTLAEDSAAQLAKDGRTHSVARLWNETLLEGVRHDFARPTVHARNLWHSSAAMYDAWAVYDDTASTWLLGKTQFGFSCGLDDFNKPGDIQRAREQAISYAAYRIIRHRFALSPGVDLVDQEADALMAELGFDIDFTSTDYQGGSPAALGNYIAECYIAYGLQDGSNEANQYAPLVYAVFNPPIEVEKPGNPHIIDLDRWQQISLTLSIDQSGNVVGSTQKFVGPEWGNVDPFSLTDAEKKPCSRDGFDLPIYMDAGPPPTHIIEHDEYQWTHTFVGRVSSQLENPDDSSWSGFTIDISPNNLGNIQSYPDNFAERKTFYERMLVDGTTADTGYTVNPVTGAPYAPQIVPLSDYTRAIAEFWADGPNSETPPGHWFVITNTISDHPLIDKRFEGQGRVLGPLEWDVKVYFALGGAVHDAAVTAWGMKGCYDYVRPVSAIRAMADRGQSTDPNLLDDLGRPTYNVDGIPLDPGRIELVGLSDPVELRGANNENVGKIKMLAWRGPTYISNPNFDKAGVGWILAENWWPYQRPTFVTPPFAGYISGHSTYSRTAAELLTLFTGDPYFPGGMSEFPAPKNEFLVFEDGPSVDMTLEWAKYIDASDQCSLSRIWGGIHPPADDMPGRKIGMVLGPQAFYHARDYFTGAL